MSGCRLYVGNISPKMHPKDVENIFAEYGRISFFSFKWKKPTNYCFVEYISYKDARYAMNQLSGFKFYGKSVIVNYTKDSNRYHNNNNNYYEPNNNYNQRQSRRQQYYNPPQWHSISPPRRTPPPRQRTPSRSVSRSRPRRHRRKHHRRNRRHYNNRRYQSRSVSRSRSRSYTRSRSRNKSLSPQKDDDEKSEISYVQSDDEDIDQDEIKGISDYDVNYLHVKIAINEILDGIQTNNNHNSSALLKLFDKIDITSDDIELWAVDDDWYGGTLSDKNSAKHSLKSLVGYVDNGHCSEHIKIKFKVIIKLILDKGIENSSSYKQILLLLASHGSVCNVMKEVAINNAYGLMTDKLDNILKMQSLKQQIIKTLRDYRVLLVEELFHKFDLGNNTHSIAGFHNIIAKKIGIQKINDLQASSWKTEKWSKSLDKRFFREMYTKENILNHITKQINEKKISYQKIVKFFEDNCPKDIDDKNIFLQNAIDINTGKINEKYLCWLLRKLKIFIVKKGNWKDIQKCWDIETK